MRRLLASLLLALISFSLVSPLSAAKAASKLPACCLRGGKHHCAMDAPASGRGGPALKADCPFQKHGSPALAGAAQSFAVTAAAIQPVPTDVSRLESLPDLHQNRRLISVHSERGPPSRFK